MKNLKILLNAFLFCAVLALLVSACRPTKFKVQRIFDKHPIETKQECVSRYPVETEYTTVQEYIPGDTVFISGPVIDCDSVLKSTKGSRDTVYIKKVFKVPCPPTKIIHDTFRVINTTTIQDTRRIDLLNLTISQLDSTLSYKDSRIEKLKITRNRYFIGFTILLLILTLLTYLRFKK